MHSCIIALVLVLASLSSALEISAPHQPPLLALQSTTAPISTCIERFTAYYYASYNYVFFNDPADPEFDFTIVTSHLKFYPHTLAQWLEERNFTVVAQSYAEDDWLCGWHVDRPVVVDGRRHGTIGWKRNDLRSKSDTLNSGNFSTAGATSRSYVPHAGPIKPSRLTIARVEAILRENTPWADMYYFRCMMLGIGCGMLGLSFVWYGLMCYAEVRRQQKKLRGSTDSDDIELDQIQVHDLSGSGMERMDKDEHTEAPKFDIEMAKPNAVKLSPSSIGSSVADPPPMYTLDGAGRSPVRVREMV
ncbi:hypothetical protein E8E12_008004 [Didymella heteroderae]|uniref:Uncharacterized protein n=1 Tax=Didymella heteroderae TaxID=1769908 RepID=A0A9P4WPI2_9PLEO|nr:hypothetical protein E8E12_008004 [Didymella heteroderae]